MQEELESPAKLKIPLINYICVGSIRTRPTNGAKDKKRKKVEKRKESKERKYSVSGGMTERELNSRKRGRGRKKIGIHFPPPPPSLA